MRSEYQIKQLLALRKKELVMDSKHDDYKRRKELKFSISDIEWILEDQTKGSINTEQKKSRFSATTEN